MRLERKLGGDGTLAAFVAAGLTDRKSWTVMAAELTTQTEIEISDETLRRWFADRVQVQVQVLIADQVSAGVAA